MHEPRVEILLMQWQCCGPGWALIWRAQCGSQYVALRAVLTDSSGWRARCWMRIGCCLTIRRRPSSSAAGGAGGQLQVLWRGMLTNASIWRPLFPCSSDMCCLFIGRQRRASNTAEIGGLWALSQGALGVGRALTSVHVPGGWSS